ncbi:hypothetical protein [Burkholderia sp. AU16741]|uniref:hypothetical protein n=1 Tax=Burkholderia sp. AU16741 TaxID=2015347 RepID=UPI00117D4CC7|nr:hypothetical protein [Burkholderia sp. AU16741]
MLDKALPVGPESLGWASLSHRTCARTAMRSIAVEARTTHRSIWLATLLILGLNIGGYGTGWYHYNEVLAEGFRLWRPGGDGDVGLYVRGAMAADYSLIRAPSVTDWPMVAVYICVVALLLWGIWRSPIALVRWELGGVAAFFGALVVIGYGIDPITTRLTISGQNHLIVQGTRQVSAGHPVELCSIRNIWIESHTGRNSHYIVEAGIFPAEAAARPDANELVIFDTATSARAFANDLNEARQANCRK